MAKIINTEAVVIKRFNYGDSDRFITLFSKEQGKITALAKSVRKVSSRKRAALEPLNHCKVSLVLGTRTPLLSEAYLLNSFPAIKQTLPRLTQAMQIMEIVDKLTAEEEPHFSIYSQIIDTLSSIDEGCFNRLTSLDTIKFLLSELGFGYINDSELKLKDHIEEIAQHRLVAKKYLMAF